MDPTERHRIAQHWTASGVVICADHVLLVHHRRIGAWLPPGGHIDDFEMPDEAAVREILEETGVAVEVVTDPSPASGDADGFFLKNPLCIQAVKAQERGESFYHLDLVYLCRPRGITWRASKGCTGSGLHLPEIRPSKEVREARWVELSQLDNWHLARNVRPALALARRRIELLAGECSHHDQPA